MRRKLSTRILIPNLFIIIGSLFLLMAAMLFSVSLFMQQEMMKELITAQTTMEKLIRVGALNSLGDSLTQSKAEQIVRYAPLLFADFRAVILTSDMQYPTDAAERPLPEDTLAKISTDGGISTIQSGGSSYLFTAIPFKTANGSWNMVIYTSLNKMYAFIRRLALILLPALAGASLTASVASVFVSRRIAVPLKRLSRWAHTIGGRRYGRFSGQSGTVEIDFLAESLNGMAQRLEDYDEAQIVFLQNASHELRTPLMSIQGYAEGIKHGVFSDTAYASDIIISESLRLSALVDDLLYLSRLETTEDFYSFTPVSIAEVLGQCAEKLEGAAIKEAKDLSLLPCPEAVVNGDGEKLLRAFLNLAGNGLRYAKSRVEMKAELSGSRVVVTVSDDGPGFDKEDMRHLFARFYKGRQGKFGLGLSIAKAIVEKHGGSISAANGVSGGAVFRVELPVVQEKQINK